MFRSNLKTCTGVLFLGLALGLFSNTASAQNGKKINFNITNGQVIPGETFAVKVTILGSAITSGGRNLPVTAQVQIKNNQLEPFGNAVQPLTSNLNDQGPVREQIIDNIYQPNMPITITGTSWNLLPGRDGSVDDDYYPLFIRNSNGEAPYVKVLRNGDAVPSISGFQNQTSIADFVKNYVDLNTNTMVLGANQAIYLFELGVTDLNSSAADFQDLVVLVTIGKTPAELAGATTVEPLYD